MVFVYVFLISLSIMPSKSIYVVTNGKTSFLFSRHPERASAGNSGTFRNREMKALDLAAQGVWLDICLLHPPSAPVPAPSRVPLACPKNPTA